ncbi:MAG: P-loop NTPase fold protein [Saprospiraceae bacterium]|nr:hypothetical protein [Saprospiraceae bacterium]
MQDIIERYIKKSPSFSLMIDGKWGSGKTYFIKHTLNKIILDLGKKMIYTTANGIRSFSEINSQILLGNYNLNNKSGEVIRLAYELGKEALNSSEKYKASASILKSIEIFSKKENLYLSLKMKIINRLKNYRLAFLVAKFLRSDNALLRSILKENYKQYL